MARRDSPGRFLTVTRLAPLVVLAVGLAVACAHLPVSPLDPDDLDDAAADTSRADATSPVADATEDVAAVDSASDDAEVGSDASDADSAAIDGGTDGADGSD